MTVSKWERGVAVPTPYQETYFGQFQVAAKKPDVQNELKNVLIVAGFVGAMYFLLKAATKK